MYIVNGTLKWKFSTNDWIRIYTGNIGNVVYAGSNDKRIYALNTKGDLRWSYQTGGRIASSPSVSQWYCICWVKDRIAYMLSIP